MIDILFNCFNSHNFYLILIVGLLLYFFKKKSTQNELIKVNLRTNNIRQQFLLIQEEEKAIIDSIGRRAEECPQQYPNGWLPVYDSHDLKKGEVKPIFALGRDLVIYRGTSGKVYVFDAYCPHLGANLGVGGTVVGEDIKCHFHGWQFNNQGDCNAIPGLEDKSIPKATIRKWRCDEVNDFIYVWHHLDGKEPDWFMTKSDKLESFVHRGTSHIKTYCHIQDIIENEADEVHFETIHPPETIIPKVLQNIIKSKFIVEWKACDPPNTHCSQFNLIACMNIFGLTFARLSATILALGPAGNVANCQLDIGIKLNFLLTFNVITLGTLKQLIVIKLYSKPSILGFIFAKIMKNFFGRVANPDLPVWNGKRFLRSPQFTKIDESIVVFRRWYKQFYSEHSNVN